MTANTRTELKSGESAVDPQVIRSPKCQSDFACMEGTKHRGKGGRIPVRVTRSVGQLNSAEWGHPVVSDQNRPDTG